MDVVPDEGFERSFLPAYALVRSILYSDYDRKNAKYSKTQIAILATLCWQNEICMSRMAELISTPRPQMTRAIIPLVNDGLVERFLDNNNRKLVYIRLTDYGKQFIRNYLHGRFETLREKINEEEAERLSCAAQTIVEILKKNVMNDKPCSRPPL